MLEIYLKLRAKLIFILILRIVEMASRMCSSPESAEKGRKSFLFAKA